MVFSSIPFLFYFLPCVLLVYFLVPKKLKNSVLLISSLVFYAWGEPKFVLAMIFAVAQGYLFGILIEKHRGRLSKIFTAISVIISLSVLIYCKYTDFFISNFNSITGMSIPLLKVVLPIGISFYTFQIVSYIIDVYREDAPAQHNIINLAAYVAMFPQLIAGPIVRYSDISKQLENREHSIEKCALGIRRFIIGLGKKVLIANVLGELCSTFKASEEKSVLFFWIYAVAYTLHIYFDFSGYSDMAIGLGKILGFDFLENFNYPYISDSVTEFWRRWHISLGSWFRDYVYIPLEGNRVSKPRWFFNIMVVWMLTGFWHGASWNFIVWGLYFGVILIIEKLFLLKFLKKSKVLSHLYVIILVIFSFVLFDALDINDAFVTIRSMLGFSGASIISAESIYYIRSYAVVFIIAIIGSTPLLKTVALKLKENKSTNKLLNVAEPIFLLAVFILSVGYIVDGSFNPFLYFRF